MFSIIIPSLNNIKYLSKCIESIKKNSKFKHEIIVHINIGADNTKDYLKENKIKFTYSKYNAGVCEGVNSAAKISSTNYILYSHDDFYFCPGWDEALLNEVNSIGHNKFYLSGTMIQNGHLELDCGSTIDEFNEEKLLNNFNNSNNSN